MPGNRYIVIVVAVCIGACVFALMTGKTSVTHSPPSVEQRIRDDVEPGNFASLQDAVLYRYQSNLNLPSREMSGNPIRLERVFKSLELTNLTQVAPVPGSPDRFFGVEKSGRLIEFSKADQGQQYHVILDLTDEVATTQNGGLLGIAFDPNFGSNRRIYLQIVNAERKCILLLRYTLKGNIDCSADIASRKEILEIPVEKFDHLGGCIQFSRDQSLYISIGYGSAENESQNLASLAGSIVRIVPTESGSYTIPKDNPFVDQAGVRPEIWAYGLRNPWRFCIDEQSNSLITGDVGGTLAEEINLVQRGGNYGWPAFEGEHRRPEASVSVNNAISPLISIPVSKGRAVIGGFRYRGNSIRELHGKYVYGDYFSGKVMAVEFSNGKLHSNKEVGFVSGLCSFFEDHQHELYAMGFGGQIYQFRNSKHDSTSANSDHVLLSDTRIFKDLVKLKVADGLVEYQVSSPLWSDGATKRRWIALPENGKIGFHPTEAWEFPLGTVLVKHFDKKPSDDEEPIRIETRLMILEASGWSSFTYRWNDQQTDAVLHEAESAQIINLTRAIEKHSTEQNSLTGSLPIHAASATISPLSDSPDDDSIEHYLPSNSECMMCHTPAAGFVLGLQTKQLNHPVSTESGPRNLLQIWNELGMFKQDIGETSQYVSMPDPHDKSATWHDRARSWLDTNCSHCHQPGGPTRSVADLRYEVPLEETNLINGQLFNGSQEIRLVTPFNVKASDIFRRLNPPARRRMPPVGTLNLDQKAKIVLYRWIMSGASTEPIIQERKNK